MCAAPGKGIPLLGFLGSVSYAVIIPSAIILAPASFRCRDSRLHHSRFLECRTLVTALSFLMLRSLLSSLPFRGSSKTGMHHEQVHKSDLYLIISAEGNKKKMKIFRCNSINFQPATRGLSWISWFRDFNHTLRKECSSKCTAQLYCLTPSFQIYALYK